jgi:hypothetical protein
MTATANKTDAGNGSKAICRVSNVLRSPSPDPSRSVRILQNMIYEQLAISHLKRSKKQAECTEIILDQAARELWLWNYTRIESLTTPHPRP